MKLKKIIIILALFVLAIPTAAFASESDGIIKDGETVNGDLTLYTSTTIEDGATVNGDVAVFGGTLDLFGTINGDLIVFAGDAVVEGSVYGNIVVIGGDLKLDSAATIDGSCALLGGDMEGTHDCFHPVSSELNLETFQDIATLGEFPAVPTGNVHMESHRVIGFFSILISMVFTSLGVGGIAYLVAAAVPYRMYEVRSAVKNSPYAAGSIGVLTAIAGSSFLIITSLIWAPLLALLTLVCGLGILLGLAGLFYLVTISLISWFSIGTLMAKRFGGEWSDPAAAGIGTAALTFGLGMLGMWLPGLTILLVFLLFCAGLGGVVLTKLGRQPYPAQPDLLNEIKINQVISTLPSE